MKKIKIAHIRDSGGFFGGEQVILTISKNINKNRFKTHLICINNIASLKLEVLAKAFGVNVVSIPIKKKFDLRAIFRLRAILKGNHIDIIHTHDFKSDFYGLLATTGSGIKRIATSHGSTKDSFLLRCYLLFTEILVYNFYNKIISVSKKQLLDLYYQNPFLKKKLTLIENGFDINLLKNNIRDETVPNKQKFDKKYRYVAIIGRLYPDKGHRYLFRAVKKILDTYSDIKILVVGDGPLHCQLVSLSRELGIGKAVQFFGFAENMDYIYSNIFALVIPSLREGLPYVLLEAMAFRVPVIASRVGGIPQVIQNQQNGYLVEPGNETELFSALTIILNPESNLKSIKENGYRTYMKFYSHVPMLKKTEALYIKTYKNSGLCF